MVQGDLNNASERARLTNMENDKLTHVPSGRACIIVCQRKKRGGGGKETEK